MPAGDGLLHAMLTVACLEYEARGDGKPVSIKTNTRTGTPRVVGREADQGHLSLKGPTTGPLQAGLEWLAPMLVAAFTLGTILFLRRKPGAAERASQRVRRAAKKER